MIKRETYLNQLISRLNNGLIKIITGIRRCGKSYLLFNIFYEYLLSQGIKSDNIIKIALDNDIFADLRNPLKLKEYILQRIEKQSEHFYIFIDEIQFCYKIKKDDTDEKNVAPEDVNSLYISFYDVLNGLLLYKNIDIYITGSNSKMLSSDIASLFRGRGDCIQIHPLSFMEYYSFCGADKSDAWENYMVYGGMPQVVLEDNEKQKRAYLVNLFENVYLKDIVERYNLTDDILIGNIVNVLSSAIGSLTNPHKLVNTLSSVCSIKTSDYTLNRYLNILTESFLFKKVNRYDVKGKKYFNTPSKYYAEDVGLRNARLNWRQQEKTHIMENILFNELNLRNYSVDVGVVGIDTYQNEKRQLINHEIDFIVNTGFKQIYIQSAFSLTDAEKEKQELLPLRHCRESFAKYVITGGNEKYWIDDYGIIHVGIIPFLLDKNILE